MLRSERRNKKTVLMYLDLDRFKIINDTLGHTVGDLLLVAISKKLRSIVKSTDTVARLGGDEFTIILEDINNDQDIIPIAERIINEISKPIDIDGRELSIGISIGIGIGIALFPSDDTTTEGLIMKADSAVYLAKDSGRGKFAFFSNDLQKKNELFLDIENKIKKAIQNNDFILYYQPKILIEKEKYSICGAEALLRFKTNENNGKKIYIPDQFIKIAEDTGLIVQIGKWVIEESCRVASTLKSFGINIHIAFNTSVKQYNNFDIVEVIKKT